MAGNQAARTGDSSQHLTPLFNAQAVAKEIGAQVTITQAFSREAPQAVARTAAAQQQDLQAQASRASDPITQAALAREAAHWQEGGAYRVALHAVGGGGRDSGLREEFGRILSG